jgi:beta-galactosidase
LRVENAQVLATYGAQFYAGTPALTENRLERAARFYIASRNDAQFNDDFLAHLIESCDLRRALEHRNSRRRFGSNARKARHTNGFFVLNFNAHSQKISLPDERFRRARKIARRLRAGTTTFGAAVFRAKNNVQIERLILSSTKRMRHHKAKSIR